MLEKNHFQFVKEFSHSLQHNFQQQSVEVYCQHLSTKSKGNAGLKKFLSGEDLVSIFDSGRMQAFIQKYNVAKYFSKVIFQVLMLVPHAIIEN